MGIVRALLPPAGSIVSANLWPWAMRCFRVVADKVAGSIDLEGALGDRVRVEVPELVFLPGGQGGQAADIQPHRPILPSDRPLGLGGGRGALEPKLHGRIP